MDSNTILGEIVKVNVRNVWPHEQYNFTPWLAMPENIARLGDAIGIELEVEGIEISVGPYSADILARDLDGRYVVIENQFGQTNHDHLGKLLTYGSFLNASVVIWIAERFTEEHQKAVEWINDRTTDELSLFAVSLELWTIEGSKPAVRFNVLSSPHELVKRANASKQSTDLTPAKKTQLEFWTAVRDRLVETGTWKTPQTPQARYWFDVPLGRTGIYLSNIANVQEGRVGIRVYVKHQLADWMLPALESQKAEIEQELGEKLIWNPSPEKRDKTIVLNRTADLSSLSEWDSHVDWMVRSIGKFRRVFEGRIRSVDEAAVAGDPGSREE